MTGACWTRPAFNPSSVLVFSPPNPLAATSPTSVSCAHTALTLCPATPRPALRSGAQRPGPFLPGPFLAGPRGPAEPRAGRGVEAAGPGRAAPPAPPQHCRHRGRGGAQRQAGPLSPSAGSAPLRAPFRGAPPLRSVLLLSSPPRRPPRVPRPAPRAAAAPARLAGRRSFPREVASPPRPAPLPSPPRDSLRPAAARPPRWRTGSAPGRAARALRRPYIGRAAANPRAARQRDVPLPGGAAERSGAAAAHGQHSAGPTCPQAAPQLVGDFFRPLPARRSERRALFSSPETSLEGNPSALPLRRDSISCFRTAPRC